MAPWLTFRSLLRTRWAVWLGLALFVGATAGAAMAGLAGARRTASAYDRFVDRHRAYDVIALLDCPPSAADAGTSADGPDTSCVDEVAELPSVADITIIDLFSAYVTTEDGRSVQPEPDACYSGPGRVDVVGDRAGRFGDELNEIRIVAGRRADPAAADEVVLSRATADRLGLEPGSTLLVSMFDGAACEDGPDAWRRPIPLRVVGIGLAPGEVPPSSGDYFGTVHVTPAFAAAQPLPPDGPLAVPIRLRAGADAETFMADVARMGGRAEVVIDLDDMGVAVARGIRPHAVSLGLVAGLVALAGGCILGQILVRQSDADAADRRTLAALGMSRRGQFATAMLPATVLAVVAGLTAGIIAVAASPLTPIGLAGQIEPDPGLSLDAAVLGGGALATALFVLIVIAVAAWRQSGTASARKVATRRRSAAAGSGMASAGMPPTFVSGVQMALNRSGGRGAVPVVTSVAAMGIAMFAVVGSLTFGAGLSHLLHTPRLTGVAWDLRLPYPVTLGADGEPVPIERGRIEAVLADHPGIESFAAGTYYSPFPQGRPLQLGPERRPVLMISFAGNSALGPSIIEGRAPVALDEVLVGRETLDDLGVALGDTIAVYGQAGSWESPGAETSMQARIVGIGVIPAAGGEARLGRGVALTLDGVTRLNPDTAADSYWLRLTTGSDAATVVPELLDTLGASVSFGEPAYFDRTEWDMVAAVGQLEQVDRVPQVFAIVMGVMVIGVMIHVLVSSLRANRRDLAVMRALGFRRREVGRAVAWQSITYAVAALAVGLPLGIVAGSIAWREYAESLGVVPEAVVPWLVLAVIAAASLTIAGVIGIALSRRTTAASPATAFKSE